MKQEFVTSSGKVCLENGILFIRKLKPSLTFSEVVKVVFPVLLILRFILYFFEDSSPKRKVGFVLFGLLSLFYGIELGYRLFKAVFRQSFSTRIPLQKIHSYRMEEDASGLEVYLFLQLRSGRERKIPFRKLEKQHEEFIRTLSQHLAVPGFAG